jgi:hypothetical protein
MLNLTPPLLSSLNPCHAASAQLFCSEFAAKTRHGVIAVAAMDVFSPQPWHWWHWKLQGDWLWRSWWDVPLGPTSSEDIESHLVLTCLICSQENMANCIFYNGKNTGYRMVQVFFCVPLLAHQKIFDNFGTIPKCSDAVDVQDNCLDTVVHKGIFMLRFLKSGICSIQVLDARWAVAKPAADRCSAVKLTNDLKCHRRCGAEGSILGQNSWLNPLFFWLL